MYFFGGIAKLNSDWLAGEPMRMWLAQRSNFWLIGQFFTEEWAVYLFSYGGLLLDLFIVPLLLYSRTRALAFGLVVGFHTMNTLLFHIGIFPILALAATTLFFAPDWPLKIMGKIQNVSSNTSKPVPLTISYIFVVYFYSSDTTALSPFPLPGKCKLDRRGA